MFGTIAGGEFKNPLGMVFFLSQKHELYYLLIKINYIILYIY
jgi:hypothetical protein